MIKIKFYGVMLLYAFLQLWITDTQAQNNWDGDHAVGNFSFCNNWYSNACPGTWNSTTDLIFNYRNNSSQTSMYFDLGSWRSVNNIIYQPTFAAGIPLDGSSGIGIDFYGKVENYSSNFLQTINIPLSGKNTTVIELNPVNGAMLFYQPIYNNNNVPFHVWGNNGKKLTLENYPEGNASVKLFIKQYSIVEVNYNNPASLAGGYVVESGELWVNSNGVIQGPIQVGNGTPNFNKIYISHASAATTVANAISIPFNSPNTTVGGLNTSGTHTYSGAINLNNNDVYFDEYNLGGTLNFTAGISGTGGIRKINAGTIRLSASNSYSGTTAVNGGTVQLGTSNAIANSSPIVLNGGTFSSGNSTGYSDTVGSLALLENSNIALGTGSHTLNFAASDAVAWTSGKILTITGWTNSCNGPKIFVGNSATGLTSSQLSQITFQGYPAGAKITAAGELVPNNILLTATGGTLKGAYATLKAAFDAINLGTHFGTVTISLVNDTVEPATAVLNHNPAATSVLIQPSGCGPRTISGDIPSNPMIDFGGADNVTVNGINSGGNSLTISNTSTSAATGTSTIRFAKDASSNTITNCTILGSSTSATGTNGGNIWFGANAIATGNDNNTVSNCSIGPANGNFPSRGIYLSGSTTAGFENSDITITNNSIYDYFSATVGSAGIEVGNGSTLIAITNNRLYQTSTKTLMAGVTHNGIRISNPSAGNGYTVTGNVIGYSNASGSGTYSIDSGTTANSTFNGIYIGAASSVSSSIQGNTIAGISFTNAPATNVTIFYGININGGFVNVGNSIGNTIGLPSAPISIATTTSATATVYGIYSTSTSPSTLNIHNNAIQSISLTGTATTPLNFSGLNIVSTADYDIKNNSIGNAAQANSISIGTPGPSTAIYNTRGIVSGATGNVTIGTNGAPNTIQNITVLNNTATCLLRPIEITGASSSTTIDYNIIKGLRYSGTSASASTFTAISVSGAATAALTISNNVLGNLSSGLIQYDGPCSGQLYGINIQAGSMAGSLTIVDNDITGITNLIAATSSHGYINNSTSSPAININDNTFTNLNVNTSGGATFISNSVALPAGGTKNVNNNSIVGTYTRTGLTGSVIGYNDTGSGSAAGALVSNLNNNFSNITVQGATTITGWLNFETGFTNKTITGNTFANLTAATGNITGMNVSHLGGNTSISMNTISSATTAGVIIGINIGGAGNATSVTASANTITGLNGGNNVFGINNSQPATTLATTVNNNTITGLSSTTGSIYAISDGAMSPSKTVSNNTISNLATSGAVVIGVSCSDGDTIVVSNNTLSGFTSSANDGIFGVYAGPSNISTSIIGNTANGFTGTNTGTGSYIRVLQGRGTSPSYINNNTITNMNSAGVHPLYALMGIYISGTSTGSTVNGNTLYNLAATNTSASTNGLAAILSADVSAGGIVSGNRIYALSNASSASTSVTAGFMTWGGTWTVANNMMSLTNTDKTKLFGITEINNLGSRKYYYNSIYISGAGTGTSYSSAINSLGNVDIKNNILINDRTNANSNYALVLVGSISTLTSDYNILNTANPATVAYLTTDRTFTAWQAASGNDSNSYSALPITFTNVTTADLHIVSSCSDIESNGTPVSVTTDYDSEARSATTPDVGADEFSGVKPADVTYTPNVSICFGASTNLTVSSTDASYVYTWSPSTGLNTTTGPTVNATPAVTTAYTVTATTPGGCVKTQFITVTVNSLPTAISVSPSTIIACLNSIQSFTATPVSNSFITIGNNTGTSVAANTPYRKGISTSESRVQYLITKAELNARGLTTAAKITSLGFIVTNAGSGNLPSFSIGMANTAATSMASTYIATAFTTVYTATNLPTPLGTNTHTFTTPFMWDGISNIVVNICHTGPSGTAATVQVTSFASPMTTSGIAAGQCASASGITQLNRPVMIVGCENIITWSPVTDLYTDSNATIAYIANTHSPTVYAKPSAPQVYTAMSTSLTTGCSVTATGSFTTATSAWNGTSWSIAPAGNTSINFNGDYASSGNLAGCSCTVTSGNVVFNDPDTLTLTNGLTVSSSPGATLTFNNNSSLLQLNDASVNSGIFTMQRITEPMYRYDYTYWGSPVTFASNYTLGDLSPFTQFDKFYSWTPTVANNFGTWQDESTATVMVPATGYIVRAPQTYSTNPLVRVPYIAYFTGTPTNGVVTTPIYHGNQPAPDYNDDFNLLSNPYPSALDAEKFLSDPLNIPILDGTIYFWTHHSPPSVANPDPIYGDFVYNYNNDDYASWNKLGGTGTTAAAYAGGAIPTGFIATGQGFFARSTGSAVSGAVATFNNSMRTAGNNNQFFRNASPNASESTSAATEKHRLWLNLIDEDGGFSQILVGYAAGATLGIDRDYDGAYFSDNNGFKFYSVVEENALVIQGRPLPFTEEDIVPLGITTSNAGTFSLRIDHFDTLFDNHGIYIEDTFLNTIHDLKQQPFSFTAGAGTLNDRFVLRFTNQTLGTPSVVSNSDVLAFIDDMQLQVKSTQDIGSITVFDILGKQIVKYVPEINDTSFSHEFPYANGIYIIKILLNDGSVVGRKVVNGL